MSIQAVAWVLDESDSGGTDRLVAIALANEADSDGWVSATKAVIARKAHVSESTVWRALDRLVALGDIYEAVGDDLAHAPTWWRGLPANRRPRVFRFHRLGSRSATPGTDAAPVLGSRRGRVGVAPRRDASLVPSPEGQTIALSLIESEARPDNPPPRKRARDPLWDAIAVACGYPLETAKLTSGMTGMLRRARTDIAAVGGLPGDVDDKAAAYRRRFGNAELTPTALAKWWPSLSVDEIETDADMMRRVR